MAKETAEGRARALIADSGACSSEESLELSSGDIVGLANLIRSHDRLLRACKKAFFQIAWKPPWDDAGWVYCGRLLQEAAARATGKPCEPIEKPSV